MEKSVALFYCKNISKKIEKVCKNLLTNSKICVIIRHNQTKGNKQMKTFMVKYTEDFGKTYHTVIINADTFTEAYVQVDIKLSKDGAITDLFEII